MTFREFLDDHVGGLIPLAGVTRTVHAVDGVTYRLKLTWCRRQFGVDYHTSRLPRAIRKARAAEYARLIALDNERLAGLNEVPGMAEKLAAGHRFVAGDVIPSWVREIPSYVLEVRDSQFDVWRRPANDAERMHEGQEYDWVHATRDGIAGHTTNEGLYDWAPLTVTAVAVDIEDARNAA